MKWESSSDILSVVSGQSCFYLRVKGVLPSDAVRKMIIGGYYVTENHARSAHSQEQHFTAALDGSVQRQGTLF